MDNLEDLISMQWEPIWNSTKGFNFKEKSIQIIHSPDRKLTVVMAAWESKGVKDSSKTFRRTGRATLVLKNSKGDICDYIAVHTHFSQLNLGS